MDVSSHLFEWIATGLMTVLVGMGFIGLRRTRDFQTFITKVDTVFLGYDGSGGMIQKVDLLMKSDAALEGKLRDERHNMRGEMEKAMLEVTLDIRAQIRHIEEKLEKIDRRRSES